MFLNRRNFKKNKPENHFQSYDLAKSLLAKKPDSRVREPVTNIKIVYECLFWLYYRGLIFEITKNGHFGAKPETGQDLSGKFFCPKVAELDNKFDAT